MKNFRLSIVFLLLAVLLAAVPAFAQETTFGASEEDFALWTAANEGLTATSAQINLSISLSGIGIGEDGADVTAEITGTGAFDATDPSNPLFQLDISGTADGEPVTLNLRIVDGFAYANDGDGWEKTTLEEALGDVTGELGVPAGDVDPSDLSSDSAMSMAAGLEEFISLTRSDEDGLAKFSLSVDIAGMLTSPSILGMLTGAMGMGGGEEMSEAQMQQMSQMFGAMFADAEVSFDEYVDPASQQLNRAVFNLDFPLEAVLGAPGAGITLVVDAQLSSFGEPVTVEVPEGAVEASS